MKKLILIIFLFSSCVQDKLLSIKVSNKTNQKIFCDETLTYLSDSICKCFSDFSEKSTKYEKSVEARTINLNSSIEIEHGNSFNSKIYYSESKSIMISIFYADSIKKYTWNELYGKRKWVKQYKLTVEDLDSLKWTIVFDGK